MVGNIPTKLSIITGGTCSISLLRGGDFDLRIEADGSRSSLLEGVPEETALLNIES